MLTTVTWDDAGNRIGFGADTYTYDARNRLLSGPEGTYSYTPRGTIDTLDDGVTTTTYVFDGLSRMASYADGTTTVGYAYDGLDRIATRDTDSFSYAGVGLDPVSDATYTWARSPGGRLLTQSDGVTALLAGVDRHGDLTHLFTAAGVVSNTALFDPFGDQIGSSGTTGSTLGFQSDYTDPSSEHVWMGARWYDGGWAAFLSRDTVFGELATPISLNRYTYGFANPLAFFDPDGRIGVPLVVADRFGTAGDGKGRSEPADKKQPTDADRPTVLDPARRLLEFVELVLGAVSQETEPSTAHTQDLGLNPAGDHQRWMSGSDSSVGNDGDEFRDSVYPDTQESLVEQNLNCPLFGRPIGVTLSIIPGVGATDFCRGFRSMSPTAQGIDSAILTAGPLEAVALSQGPLLAANAEPVIVAGGAKVVDIFAKLSDRVFGSTGVEIPLNRVSQIFREAEGHLTDTVGNRELLTNVANDAGARLGTDQHGNEWFSRLLDNGRQVWVTVRGGEIVNGGVNVTPRTFDPTTGLSNPTRP